MLARRLRGFSNLQGLFAGNVSNMTEAMDVTKHQCCLYSIVSSHVDLPRKLKKSERKPWVTSVNELKRKARLEKKERQMVCENILRPPENGMLVKDLVPVAHQVYSARTILFDCVSRVLQTVAVYTCR